MNKLNRRDICIVLSERNVYACVDFNETYYVYFLGRIYSLCGYERMVSSIRRKWNVVNEAQKNQTTGNYNSTAMICEFDSKELSSMVALHDEAYKTTRFARRRYTYDNESIFLDSEADFCEESIIAVETMRSWRGR